MRLSELQTIRQQMLQLKATQPLEYHTWDAVLTIWLMGCVGSLGIVALELWHLACLTAPAIVLPDAYIRWRRHAHARQRVRCDWLPN